MLCAEFISIHLPVGVGQIRKEIPLRRAIFQSTHPVRGGTISPPLSSISRCNFNPPTPCGVGPRLPADPRPSGRISIHPPRAGWDCRLWCFPPCSCYFNPPTPCGVGPEQDVSQLVGNSISIHPPRAGWDVALAPVKNSTRKISIHPPRAGWDGTQRQRHREQ